MFTSLWSMFECDGHEKETKPVQVEDAYTFPECDYDLNCTALYKQIQLKNWVAVNQFLLTGYWSATFFADPMPPKLQTCTWVTKYERTQTNKKKVMWTHLPIHAALKHGAPDGVVQLLLNISPPTLRCADDRRMLPLHLAFMHGSSDAVLGMVLDVFPEAVAVRDFQGRTPAECAEDGPLCKRGQIISTVLFYNKKTWEKKASKAQNKQLDSIRQALGNRNERVSHLETALDLIRCREDQTRHSFSLVVAEIQKFKAWYEVTEDKAGADAQEGEQPLDPVFVKRVAQKLDMLQAYAEQLVVQQTQAKKDSDKTLTDLNAVWNDKTAADVPFRKFEANSAQATPTPLAALASHQDPHSDASSHTSLETRSTKGMEVAAPAVLEEFEEKKKDDTGSLLDQEGSLVSITEGSLESTPAVAAKTQSPLEEMVEKDDDSLTIPSEFKDDMEETTAVSEKKPPKRVVEHLEADANAPVVAVEVPGEDDADDESSIEREIGMAISEMTSLDMSEGTGASRTSSKINRMLSFGKRLKKITKRASNAAAALDSSKTLPPKMPQNTSNKSVRSNKGRVLKNPKKVAPTM